MFKQDSFEEVDQKSRRFAWDMIDLCRDNEVEVLLSPTTGCENRVQQEKLDFPRIAVALQYNQKEVCTSWSNKRMQHFFFENDQHLNL